MNLKQKLFEEGIIISSNYGQQKTVCPKCSHTRKNKRDTCLSVNIQNDVAMWHCHHCDWKGAVHENIVKPRNINYKQNVYTFPQSTNIEDDCIRYLASRRISEKTIKDFGLNSKNNILAFPYFLDGKKVNTKFRNIKDKIFYQEKNAVKSLYNIDRVYKLWQQNSDTPIKKQVIFVEGEIDVLSLYECGLHNVVSLPDGAPKEAKFEKNDKRFQAFLQSEWIFEADEVIIATDQDQAGNALKLELIDRFGKDVCKVVEFPLKDANEVLVNYDKETLLSYMCKGKDFPIEGLHSANDYKQLIQDMYDGNTQKAFSTGFEKLDEIYKVMPTTFNLITGIPNHGKSNFLDQILMNLAENDNWKFAVYSPEHSTAHHIRRLLEKRCRKPFDIGAYERISDDEKNAGIDFIDNHFKFIENTQEIPNIDYILTKTKLAKNRYGIDGLVIDPFNQISADRDNNKREDEHIRDIIAKCQQFARNYNIVVWMVAHPHKLHRNDSGVIPPPDLYQVSGSAHWANMADVGLVIHRDFEQNTTKIITRKIREQGVYGEIGQREFIFNFKTRCYQ